MNRHTGVQVRGLVLHFTVDVVINAHLISQKVIHFIMRDLWVGIQIYVLSKHVPGLGFHGGLARLGKLPGAVFDLGVGLVVIQLLLGVSYVLVRPCVKFLDALLQIQFV